VLLLLSILSFISQLGFPQTQLLRTVNLRAAADEEFRSNKNWRLEIRRLIADSSKVFEESFGIRFEINNFKSWTSDNSQNSTLDLLNDLRRKIPQGECDAVVAFTSQLRLKHDLIGVASYLRGYVLLRKMKSDLLMTKMLTHELCHLFGALDLDEKGSIMDKENQGQNFDSFTTQIILLNKYRNFNPYIFPLPKSKLDEVISICEHRKRLRKKEAEINILLASIYLEKEDYDSMIKECLQAIKINPDLVDSYHHLGIAYRRKGQIDLAIEHYQKVIQVQPDIPEVHYNLGIAWMNKGMFDESIMEYKKAIKLNPFYGNAYSNLGYAFLQKGMIDQAIENCRKALNIYPRLAEALSTLGAALIIKEKYEEAEVYSRRALDINSNLSGAHNNLGAVYMNKKNTDKAIEEYLKAVEINPEYSEAHYNLGRAYLLKGLADKSISEFKKAIQHKTNYSKAHSNLASAYLKKEMLEEAIKECQKALAIDPKNAVAHANLGHAYLKKEMVSEAEMACHKAIALNPYLPEPHNILAILFERKERIKEALAEHRKAIKLKDDYLEAHLNLANVLFKRNILAESALHYKKVIEIDPTHAQAHNNLAVIFYYQKKYEKSWEHLKKAKDLGLKVHPDFKKVLLKKLKSDYQILIIDCKSTIYSELCDLTSSIFTQENVPHVITRRRYDSLKDIVKSKLKGFDLLIISGSSTFFPDSSEIKDVAELLQASIEQNKHAFGVCFGLQLLAYLLDSKEGKLVKTGNWDDDVRIHILKDDPIFKDVCQKGDTFITRQYHKYSVPSNNKENIGDGVVLAESKDGIEIIRVGNVVASQFHPESRYASPEAKRIYRNYLREFILRKEVMN
jgi:tetratricopeptide (TPR) repeat protein